MRGIEDLIDISHFYGKDPEFVLAGGGNTSFKNKDTLYIKGSGTALGDINADGFVHIDRSALGAMWERDYSADPGQREEEVLADLLAARKEGQEGKRPSVETSLHDFFPQAFVVHTHPPLVNGLTCATASREQTKKLLGDRVLWIPTVNPGYVLAATVRQSINDSVKKHQRQPDILIMQNHGLCVAADTLAEIKTKTEWVFDILKKQIAEQPNFSFIEHDRPLAAQLAPAIRMLLYDLQGSGLGSNVVFDCNLAFQTLVADAKTFSTVSTSLSPDHIVYCAHQPLFVSMDKDLEQQYRLLEAAISDYKQKHDQLPKIIAVQNLGVFAHGVSKKNADITLAVFRDAVKVSIYGRSFGGAQSMPAEQVAFIRNWEVEAFRSKVNTVRQSGRLSGKIALVTGGAQGFGLGIAGQLLDEGAAVILADVNAELARSEAKKLGAQNGPGSTIALEVDVTDPTSVQTLIEEAVLTYGGLDLLISNAGILRAGSLEQVDLETFELVNRVNYNGFFLCCKYGTRPMKIQNRFCAEWPMDIIQINSKSGLVGSNKNFAYAGSKFACIGLVQSFALELVAHNIKVNAVCPGNFFDGPLWSDPEKGLFVQYLQAGKVPGAKSLTDVRRFYEAKVPMGRGCSPLDVVRAILYLVEQCYETGQALPVTGGQTMLN